MVSVPTEEQRNMPSDEPDSGARKDIFISYSTRDKRWVKDYLTRLLDAANLKFVIDENDFKIGAPLDESIRKLIKECRYTLLVMTPDWVRGKWTSYEAELAAQKKAEADGVSILALKLKDCDIPPDIAPRLYLDVSQARTRDQEILKLLKQLEVPEERIASAQLSVSRKTLDFLRELFAEARAREEVARLNETFLQIQESNDILQKNKTLHDRLQETEFPLQQVASQLSAGQVEAGQVNWSTLRGATAALRHELERLVSFADSVPKDLVDVRFVEPLKGIADKLDAAFQARNIHLLDSYVSFVSQKIDRSLPLVNDRIVQHVKGRRLSDLAQTIYEIVEGIEFDESVAGLLGQFRSKIDSLVDLEVAIRDKVSDHETMQSAEETLHLCNPSGEPTFSDIASHWPLVEPYISRLTVKSRYDRLLEYSGQLNVLINDVTVRDDRFAESVSNKFQDFCFELKNAFNKLDIDLLADCGKLKPCSDELQDLLQRMQNDDSQS